MFVLDHPSRMSVMVAGLPRTGTTVVASFLNSIDGATIWGEPHRSQAVSIPMRTRYGDADFSPIDDVMDQIELFAAEKGLWLYGLKEVMDPTLGVFPMEIASKYEDRIDLVLAMIRDPRKAWMSIYAIGHAKGLGWSAEVFANEYIKFTDLILDNNKAMPVVMSRFIRNPKAYMQSKLGLKIAGDLKLLQYTGGGDPATVQPGSVIRNVDNRTSYIGPELNAASELYKEVVNMEKFNV